MMVNNDIVCETNDIVKLSSWSVTVATNCCKQSQVLKCQQLVTVALS